MASSLSGASALGVFNGLGWLWTSDSECQPGDKPNNFGPGCTTGGHQNDSCLEKGMVYDYAKGDCVQKSGGGGDFVACQPGQVQWNDGGVEKCGSMSEYNAYVARVTGSGAKPSTAKASGGGVVKPTVPGVPVESQSEIPWGTIALAAVAFGGFLVWRKKRMTSNGYDEDC